MALLKAGKLDEALATYNEAVSKRQIAESYMGRAMVYDRKGDATHARADADAARKLDAKIDDRFADYGLKLDKGSAPSAGGQGGSGGGGGKKTK